MSMGKSMAGPSGEGERKHSSSPAYSSTAQASLGFCSCCRLQLLL